MDGAVYSADLADMTLKRSDIVITDSDGNPIWIKNVPRSLTCSGLGVTSIQESNNNLFIKLDGTSQTMIQQLNEFGHEKSRFLINDFIPGSSIFTVYNNSVFILGISTGEESCVGK